MTLEIRKQECKIRDRGSHWKPELQSKKNAVCNADSLIAKAAYPDSQN